MHKAVIFDMDGVLADTRHDNDQALILVLKKHGVNISKEDLIQYIGLTCKDAFSDMIQKYGIKASVLKLRSEKEIIQKKIYSKNAKAVPGAIRFFDQIKTQYNVAIATNTRKQIAKLILKQLGILDQVKTITYFEDIKKPKPNPEIYRVTANKLDVKASECIVVEDSTVGISAAKSAGMTCIAIDNPNSPDQDLKEADIIIKDYTEGIQWIKEKTMK